MPIVTRVNGSPPPHVDVSDVDLGSWRFWSRDDDFRDGAFATLRRQAPVSFHEPISGEGVDAGAGHWALVRYDDVHFASRHPDLFSSSPNITIGDQTPELAEYFGSMIAMDDPRHSRLRNIVRSAFTPKVVARIEESVRERARHLVATMVSEHPDGRADLVTALAGPLPLQVICDMMGIAEHDHDKIFHWTNVILGFGDPDLTTDFEEFATVAMEIGAYATELAEDRRARPGEDLTTALVAAEVDGEQLTSAEVASFFILLVVAGNETTRTAISHGMKALTDHPDQRALWFGDFETHTKTAVEEIVRWATPVISFRRTAVEDTEIRGVPIAAGQKVVMFYNSGNRDEEIFADPYRFDVTRTPVPAQIGFGAGGPHFCLGANLARREIAVMFDEIRRRVPEMRITGPAAILQSGFINGIKRMPCAW